MTRITLKKGDSVKIIAGKNKGQEGVIERVIPSTNRVVVAGLNLVKKHLKPSQTNPKGGLVSMPAPIHRSNVMMINPSTNKTTRIKHKITNGVKQRVSQDGSVSLDK